MLGDDRKCCHYSLSCLFVGSSKFGSSLALDLPTKDAADFLLVGPREIQIFLKLESKKW
jgi:hypothetical protein